MNKDLRIIPQPLRGDIAKALSEAFGAGEVDDLESAVKGVEIAYPLILAELFPPMGMVIPGSTPGPDMSEEEAFRERWEYDKELNLWVHAEGTCRGAYCCIHNPSDHPLKAAPRNWRGDRNLMERICRHGVGHPDPDDIAYHALLEADPDDDDPDPFGRGIHGCCAERCCSITA